MILCMSHVKKQPNPITIITPTINTIIKYFNEKVKVVVSELIELFELTPVVELTVDDRKTVPDVYILYLN
jgi:hypothetical protein